jgi:hypothetical protein
MTILGRLDPPAADQNTLSQNVQSRSQMTFYETVKFRCFDFTKTGIWLGTNKIFSQKNKAGVVNRKTEIFSSPDTRRDAPAIAN